MRKSILTGLVALGSLSVGAQQDPSWEPTFRQINEEVQKITSPLCCKAYQQVAVVAAVG